ncbi:unnamed protein product [Calicophoron daubneyi]|uniref:Dynein light chain n=1 Tax=Calicophoron daubneyi TaxID=300641 RepID=A0AAV2TNK1_CALDB
MPRLEVLSSDMPRAQQEEILKMAEEVCSRDREEKEKADELKKECDKKYGPNWHAVVGKNFGSSSTHEVGTFIFLYVGEQAVQLFKFG